MSAVVAVVVVLLLIGLGIGGWYGYKHWKLKQRQRSLLSWAGTMGAGGNGALLDEDGGSVSSADVSVRSRSGTGVAVSDLTFGKYTSMHHKERFTVEYPADWSVHPAQSRTDAVLVQFLCPQSDRTFKRFSITWEDVSWTTITASAFAKRMIENLSRTVPGSSLVSHRPLPTAGAYEVIYTVRDPVDNTRLKKLNVVRIVHQAAFTLVFAVDEAAFPHCLDLARHMIASFTLPPLDAGGTGGAPSTGFGGAASGASGSGYGGQVPETPANPAQLSWRQATHPLGLMFAVPSEWQTAPAKGNATGSTMEHLCDRRERHYKSIKVFAANLSSVAAPRDKLLSDLLDHYKREVGKQPNAAVLEERRISSPFSPTSFLLKVRGQRALFETTSATLVGLYDAPAGVHGFIITVSTTTEVFRAYEGLARHVFQSLSGGK